MVSSLHIPVKLSLYCFFLFKYYCQYLNQALLMLLVFLKYLVSSNLLTYFIIVNNELQQV